MIFIHMYTIYKNTILNISFHPSASDPAEKLFPTVESLSRPYPETGRYADDQSHQVFDHEHLEIWFAADVLVERTRYGEVRVPGTHVHVPGEHPVVEVRLLVEEAGEHDERRHRVQDGEHADADHQLLQLVGLRAVVLHHGTDAEQRDEAGQQEDGAQRQVHEQRRQHEAAQRLHVPQPHVAHARQNVTCNTNKTDQCL